MVTRAFVYFACVFALGFVLGAFRVLWAVPRFGDRTAELVETPIMLVAIFAIARWLIRRFPTQRRVDHLVSGLLALAILLLFELAAVIFIRGSSLSEYLATRDPVSGAAYVIALSIFAVMPWVVARS